MNVSLDLQSVVTTVLVVACFVYVAMAMLPKGAKSGGGCHCDGCDHATAPGGKALSGAKPCGADSPMAQPLVFHPRMSRDSETIRKL
jgi:hypothetical protein